MLGLGGPFPLQGPLPFLLPVRCERGLEGGVLLLPKSGPFGRYGNPRRVLRRPCRRAAHWHPGGPGGGLVRVHPAPVLVRGSLELPVSQGGLPPPARGRPPRAPRAARAARAARARAPSSPSGAA